MRIGFSEALRVNDELRKEMELNTSQSTDQNVEELRQIVED